jgi:hypothetical protein
VSPYDIGNKKNWEQVFGTNKWLYPFPMFVGSGPVGDGIMWPGYDDSNSNFNSVRTYANVKNANKNGGFNSRAGARNVIGSDKKEDQGVF